MTLPASGTLVLGLTGGGNSINGEFGYGNDLGSYRGVYCGLGGALIQLPVSPNSLAMNVFYSTAKITPGSASFSSSQSFTIPVYNTITITVVGGSGGTSGTPGYVQSPCGSGNTTGYDGGSGGISSFGGYLSAAGGAGGPGSASGNNPGQSGQSVTTSYTNPVQGGSGPPSGTIVTVSVGGGGSGGGGGCIVYNIAPFGCRCWNQASAGAGGAGGYITVSWT